MAEQSVVTEVMHRAVGVETAPRTHVVEAGAVRKFAEAIGDTNPGTESVLLNYSYPLGKVFGR